MCWILIDWSQSALLWMITTPPTTPRATLRVVPMDGCDPEGERERYCFRSVWLPGLPRGDEIKHLPAPEDGEQGEGKGDGKVARLLMQER